VRHAVREAISYLLLMVIISAVLTMQIYQHAQSTELHRAFDRHAVAIDGFLNGLAKSTDTVVVTLGNSSIDCEAVFIRQQLESKGS